MLHMHTFINHPTTMTAMDVPFSSFQIAVAAATRSAGDMGELPPPPASMISFCAGEVIS